MPCTQTGSLDGDRILSLTEGLEATQKRATKLVSLLCALCTTIEYHNEWHSKDSQIKMPSEVAIWWKKHKKVDKGAKKK